MGIWVIGPSDVGSAVDGPGADGAVVLVVG